MSRQEILDKLRQAGVDNPESINGEDLEIMWSMYCLGRSDERIAANRNAQLYLMASGQPSSFVRQLA